MIFCESLQNPQVHCPLQKTHELLLNLQRKGEPEQPHIDQGQPQEHLGEGSTGVSAEINSPPSPSGFDLRAARNVFA